MFGALTALFFRRSVGAQDCSAPPELHLTGLPSAINISALRDEEPVTSGVDDLIRRFLKVVGHTLGSSEKVHQLEHLRRSRH
jgi:hypothetical protein